MKDSENKPLGYLAEEKLEELLDILSQRALLYVPTKLEKERCEFLPYGTGDLDLDSVNTGLPPKNFVFPHSSSLFSWELPLDNGAKLEKEEQEGDRILFGVRSCDARAIAILDELFLEEIEDCPYREKRDGLTLIGMACNSCETTCFCSVFEDLSPGKSGDCDLYLSPVEGGYIVETPSSKGKDLVPYFQNLLSQCPGSANSQAKEREEKTIEEQSKVLSPSFEVSKSIEALDREEAFQSDYWKTLSERCLGCRICTYLCPTCHCYEIRDEGCSTKGKRYRIQDSCMSEEFTAHASGHNPRSEHYKRWRQRCFHKFSYFPKNFDTPLCVGCGRCTLHCPVGIDLLEILKEVTSI